MRCYGFILLALLVGCTTSTDNPSTSSNTDSSTDSTHSTNKPVTAQPATMPESKPSVDRGPDEATRRDNTAVNARDNEANKTPLDQGNNETDISVTADIRKSITNHSGMSVNARNVKIITQDGKVTLRGPVNSQEEKDAIDKYAKDRAGEDKVDNQIEIVPKTDE